MQIQTEENMEAYDLHEMEQLLCTVISTYCSTKENAILAENLFCKYGVSHLEIFKLTIINRV